MRHTVIGRAVVALVAAATVAVGMITAPAAKAAEGDIDFTRTDGSIVVHKYQEGTTQWGSDSQGDPASKTTPTAGKAVEGVVFEAVKVDNYDLTKPESWNNLDKLAAAASTAGTPVTGNAANANAKLGTVVARATTDANGDATLGNLPVGLYYLVETSISGAKIDGKPVTISKKAVPFFVTVPYPKAGNAWIYNVHVYPKNGTSGTIKDVDTSKWQKKGDLLTWNIDQDIPQNVTRLGFVDYLDEKVNFSGVTVGLVNPVSGLSFVENTDYYVTRATKGERQIVKVEFSAAGIAKLKAQAGNKVRYVLSAEIKETLQSPAIPNSLYPIVNEYDPWNEGNPNPPNPEEPPFVPETPPNPPTISENDPVFGSYQFTKVDSQTPAKPLTGATFGIFEKDASGNCVVPNNANGFIATATSDANGRVSFTNILLGKIAGGKTPIAGANSKTFCMVETVAPPGFVLNTNPISITIDPGATTAPKIGENFVNTKHTGPKLPLTGASGKILLTIGGIAVIMLAVGLYMVQSRRNKELA